MASSFFIPILFILFFGGFQFLKTYLTIYTNGIRVNIPYRTLRSKFIPWDSIKDIQLYERGLIGGSHDFKSYNAIFIFLKGQQKSISISGIWVDQLEKAYDIITGYVEPIEKPEFCKNHLESKATLQCRKCGDYFCDACIEQKNFYGQIYQDCSLCLFNLGLKRIKISYSLSLLGPLLFFGAFIVNLFVNFESSLINMFYAISVIITAPLPLIVTSYGFGFYLATKKRIKKLEKLSIKFNYKSYESFSILSVFVILIFCLYFPLVMALLFPLHFISIIIVLPITYISITSGLTILFYYGEKPRYFIIREYLTL